MSTKSFRLPALLAASALAASFLAVGQASRREGPAARPAREPRLLVVVAVDGLNASRLASYRPYFTAGLKRLFDEGRVEAQCRYLHINTETGPGHAALGTGAPPSRTGIIANNWYEPRADGSLRPVYCTDQEVTDAVSKKAKVVPGPGNLRIPTLGDRLVEKFPQARVVTLSGKDRAAIFLAGKDPRHAPYWFDEATGTFVTSPAYDATSPEGAVMAKLVRRFNEKMAGGQLPRRVGLLWRKMGDPLGLTPGQEAELTRPAPAFDMEPYQVPSVGLGWDHDLSRAQKGYFSGVYYSPFVDELVADLALATLADTDLELGHRDVPDVLGISFSAQDTVSHNYGPESEENLDVLRRLDVQLGRLLFTLDRTFPEGKVVLALSADHGFLVIPEAEKKRDKLFTGGRLVYGKYAMTGFPARLNRALCQELCLPEGARPIHGTEGFDLKYNLPALPALRTIGGTCGPEGREVTREDIDRVLPTVVDRLFHEEVQEVLLASKRATWDGKDPAVSFVRNDYDPQRSGEAILVPRPNVLIHWDPARGTGHGSQWENDTHVPLIFWGRPFAPSTVESPSTPYDLAPTLGRLVGVTLPDAVGTPRL